MTSVSKEYQYYQTSNLMKELAQAAHQDSYVGQTSSANFEEVQKCVKNMQLREGARILDAGSGNGALSIALAENSSYHIDGLDLSEDLVNLANIKSKERKTSDRCNYFKGDFSEYSSYPASQYDAILCIGSLYWGQPIDQIFSVWHQIATKNAKCALFLNLAYAPLEKEEKKAVGKTEFLKQEELKEGLLKNQWSISDWQDHTETYLEWLEKWCEKMRELGPLLENDMGTEKSEKLIHRFSTYRQLAKKRTVRRIILRAEHD